MRLDKYLKVSRLIKRRSVAKEACDQKRITVNDKAAKASFEINVDDIISIRFGEKLLTVKVLKVAEHMRKEETDSMYQIIN